MGARSPDIQPIWPVVDWNATDRLPRPRQTSARLGFGRDTAIMLAPGDERAFRAFFRRGTGFAFGAQTTVASALRRLK